MFRFQGDDGHHGGRGVIKSRKKPKNTQNTRGHPRRETVSGGLALRGAK